MYAKGASALGMCDRCGQQAPLRLLVPDGYKKGLLVHRYCRDEPHPQEKPVRLSEGIALKNPRPDRDDDSPGAAVDHSGTAQAGSSNSLTLASGASAVSSDYVNGTLALTGGAGSGDGVGQSRTMGAYSGATKVTTVAKWNAEYLSLPGISGNYASTPDSAAVSITGDIDVRCKVSLDDWTPAAINRLVQKDDVSGVNREWGYYVLTDGKVRIEWWDSGGTLRGVTSSAATGFVDASTHWIRWTLDVDNGAGGHVARIYTSDDGEAWAQLGTDLNAGAFTTSIRDQASRVQVGAANGTSPMAGKFYYAELRNGIDGPVVAKFDPFNDGGKVGEASFEASTGETWTINGSEAELAPEPDSTTEYTVTVPDTLAEAMGFSNHFGGGS